MQLEELERSLKHQRIDGALKVAKTSLEDVFYACQEASTEVDRVKTRIQLERMRNVSRDHYHKIGKILDEIQRDINPN